MRLGLVSSTRRPRGHSPPDSCRFGVPARLVCLRLFSFSLEWPGLQAVSESFSRGSLVSLHRVNDHKPGLKPLVGLHVLGLGSRKGPSLPGRSNGLGPPEGTVNKVEGGGSGA